jgi:predicted membrane protein
LNGYSRGEFGGRLIAGLIILLLGLLFLMGNFYPEFDAGRFLGRLWPIILIAVGLLLIFNQAGFRRRIYIGDTSGHNRIVGDIKLDFVNKEIGNINASQIVGDLRIDLTTSKLKPGINHLDVSMIVGDTLLIVPKTFPLRISARSIAGDIRFDNDQEKGFLPRLEHIDPSYQTADDKLFIAISGIVGDMVIQRI